MILGSIIKSKKEEGMKKIFVMMLALCLAVPAISYAGSATSRWDMTIGGVVKFDFGWVDSKATGTLATSGVPARDDKIGTTINNDYGNYIWGGGETNLNFFVRGPDAWGAKTSAFVLMDFIGVWGGSNYGTADLLVATLNFDWPNTTLMMGDAGGTFGMLPTFAGNQSSWGAIGLFGDKGPAPVLSQITVTQRFTKDFSAKFGIMSSVNNGRSANSLGGNSAMTQSFRASTPGAQAGITYASDACGKVGPWRLTVGMSGGLIREKYTSQIPAVLNPAGTAIVTPSTTADDTVTGWLADLKFLVPIIPEKNGNKAMALYVDGDVWRGQNMDGFNAGWSGTGVAAYNRDGATDPDFASNVSTGFMAHAAFYFTDQLWINGYYMYAKKDMSHRYRDVTNRDAVKNAYQTILSLAYDVNPAVRFTLQWDHSYAKYAHEAGLVGIPASATLKDKGTQDAFRMAAYYYF